jgi:two-component system aerobic respiration control sensor histidine kinase ArcB
MNYSIDFAQLVDSLKVNIVWKDLNSHYIGANQHFLQLINLTPETLAGKTDFDLTTHDLAKKIIENDQEVFTQQDTRCFHEYIIDSEGSNKVYLSYKTPLYDKNHRLFGLTTLAIDVTEVNKKESELISEAKAKSSYIDSMAYFNQIATMFNQMASNIPANIYWKDSRGLYLGCNATLGQIHVLKGRDSIIGKSIHDLFPKDEADRVAKIDDKVLLEGEPVTLEEKGYDVNGNPAVYISNKAPVRNDRGEVIGLLGISLDITKQKQIEQELRDAKEKAEAADCAKSEFILNISHDIRTPFMGILGFSELLEAQEQDEFKKETLGYIRQSAQRLLSWMNEIIDVVASSGESGHDNQPIYISYLLDDLTDLMRARIELKKLQWKATLDPSIPRQLMGDLGAVRRILLNLVGNAVKFTDVGSVTIEAKLVGQTENSVEVQFVVSDTGIGIPEDKFTDIFKKFSRLTSSYSGKYPGSGLGLYNVSQIAARLGGSVTVTSSLAKGSIFTCQIPLKLGVHLEATSEA